MLEEAHYVAEAYNHYLKATQLAPTNTLYRSVFMTFKKDYEISSNYLGPGNTQNLDMEWFEKEI